MLNGKNPFDFMAALGVVHATDCRLGWDDADNAIFDLDEDEIVSRLMIDLAQWKETPIYRHEFFCEDCQEFSSEKVVCPCGGKFSAYDLNKFHADKVIRKYPEYGLAWYGLVWARGGKNEGKDAQTRLRFGAGQMSILKGVRKIAQHLDEGLIREGVFDPFPLAKEKLGVEKISTLRYDSHRKRVWARRGKNPSGDDTFLWPAKEWLAFRGWPMLTYFDSWDQRQSLVWPLWGEAYLNSDTIRGMIMSPKARIKGVQWMESRIEPVGKYYSNFAPSSRVP